jgi:hypothetical protein
MLYRNILLLVGGFIFVLASGCSNDSAGSSTANLVPECTETLDDLDLEQDWLCDNSFTVECEDGVGDPDEIYLLWPPDDSEDALPESCGEITLTLDDEGPFEVGTHDVVITATPLEGDEELAQCTAELTVEDTQPPKAIHETIDDAIELWPPNHKFHTISGEDCVRDACDGDVKVTFHSASSDEPVNDKGDGNTEPDIILGCDSVQLRSERQGGSDGRVYTLEYSAVDDAGREITDGKCIVVVPHDQSGREAIAQDPAYTVDQENECDDGTGGTGGAGGAGGEGGEGGQGGEGGEGGQGGDDGEGGQGGDDGEGGQGGDDGEGGTGGYVVVP